MKGIVVVSPSGNLYGSEQVLVDYLRHSRLKFTVVVPEDSLLEHRLRDLKPDHSIYTYPVSNPARLYLRIAWGLLTKRIHTLYINEAGHIKYLLLLAKLFRNSKFLIHVRIVEDTMPARWVPAPGSNVRVVTISDYLRDKLSVPSKRIYDLFDFTTAKPLSGSLPANPFIVGVIGRITMTKGIESILSLLEFVKLRGDKELHFVFFGEPSEDVYQNGVLDKLKAYEHVSLRGFVAEPAKIYGAIHCVLHTSTREALGRIYLEAIAYQKPLVGFRAAGIGEIGQLLGLDDLLAMPEADATEALYDKLCLVRSNYLSYSARVAGILPKAQQQFSLDEYTRALDKILS